jgi:hypothetical protein
MPQYHPILFPSGHATTVTSADLENRSGGPLYSIVIE